MQVQSKIDDFNNAGIERVYEGGLHPDVCEKHATTSFPSIETLDHKHTQEGIGCSPLSSSSVKTYIA